MRRRTFAAIALFALVAAQLVGCKGPQLRETGHLSDYSKLGG